MRRLSAFISEEVPTVIFEEENADGWKTLSNTPKPQARRSSP